MGFLDNLTHRLEQGVRTGVPGHLYHTDWTWKSAMWFLAICNHAGYTNESTMAFLDNTRESIMVLLDFCSNRG